MDVINILTVFIEKIWAWPYNEIIQDCDMRLKYGCYLFSLINKEVYYFVYFSNQKKILKIEFICTYMFSHITFANYYDIFEISSNYL